MNGPRAQFDLLGDWKALKGPVLGLAQPALIVTARVQLPDKFDLAALDAAMLEFLPEPVPAEAASGDAELALVARAVHWAGAVQRQHKIAVSERFHIERVSHDSRPATFRAYVPYQRRDAARTAVAWINLSLRHYLAHGKLAEADTEVAEVVRQRLARSLAPFGLPGVNIFRFLRAADRLRIPVRAMAPNLYQLGIGRHSRLLNSSLFDTTGAVGAQIARDKFSTALALRMAGLPAPVHRKVADEAQALETATQLGYPVVVKPNDRDQGQGVSAGLTDEAAVRAAFAEACKASKEILVEKHFDGSDYRLTVFEGRVLQVIGRRPGGVTGDGRHTLAELVELEAARPENRRRKRDFGHALLLLDDEARDLASEQGLKVDSIVGEGRFVTLRRRANVSSGGVPTSVPLSEVHPDNLELAVRAAGVLRLNIAGVDLITPEIGRSWLETGALICEMNAQPQISQTGSPEIYTEILRSILGDLHSIPIWAYVSCTAPPALAAVTIRGAALGASSAEGIWVNGAPITGPQGNAFAAARALFAHPALDAAIVHLTPADILERGLPFPHCDVAIIGSDAVEDRQALSWLAPHVLCELVLPEEARASVPSSTSSARCTFRQDPWSAVHELARGSAFAG